MSYETVRIAVLAGLVLLTSTKISTAQEVRIEQKPARRAASGEVVSYDSWTVSFSRRHAPDIFELDGTHSSLASAQAAAARIRAWSSTIRDSDWKVAVILLEGTPSYYDSGSQGALTPVDRIMAGATAQVDHLLRTTRRVARIAGGDVGGKIPNAGQVLSEYRKVVEMSYANAKELQKGLLDLQAKITEKEFAQVNSLIEQMVAGEAAQFFGQQSVGAAKLFMDEQAERSRESGDRVNQLLDRIAKTDDPAEQKRLMQELASVQESGGLRESIVAENRSQAVRDEHAAAQRHVANIKSILDESKKQQEAILKKALRPKTSLAFGKTYLKYHPYDGHAAVVFFDDGTFATGFGGQTINNGQGRSADLKAALSSLKKRTADRQTSKDWSSKWTVRDDGLIKLVGYSGLGFDLIKVSEDGQQIQGLSERNGKLEPRFSGGLSDFKIHP